MIEGRSYPGKISVLAGRQASAELRPPASKSLTQRYFALALLGDGDLCIENPLISEDTELFLAALGTCGWRVDRSAGRVELRPGERPTRGEIFCGNGGTMFRFLTAVLTTLPGDWRLDGVPRMRQRPIGPLVDALRALGARIDYLGEEGYPPLRIAGGSLQSGLAELDAGASSQYLSALLMAGMALPEGLSVRVSALTSTPYVELTLAAIQRLGGRVERPDEKTFVVQPAGFAAAGRVWVEADFSAAAYPAAAAALTGGRVRLLGVDAESRQGDRAFLKILSRMGASVSWREGMLEVVGQGLRGIDADFSNMPDQVPTLAALAPFATGTTTIRNVPNLRIKECDRLAAMATELGKLGAVVEEHPDGLVIQGSWAEQPNSEPPMSEQEVAVESYGDHRIAMSLALVGLRRPGVVIREPGVVAKSYPDFWRDLALLCGD